MMTLFLKVARSRLTKETLVSPMAALFLLLFATFARSYAMPSQDAPGDRWWQIQSVDTMKLSRDLAREMSADPSFDAVINIQVEFANDVGATHLAVGTPYDEEFLPFLRRWVDAARRAGLSVWFRGNFSGWEGWFGYSEMDREEHTRKIRNLILDNEDLFQNGDLFTSCPECENGGPGDPRKTKDAGGFRSFLINEYQAAQHSFQTIGKSVQANLYSMNGDVALLTMDPETTNELDGIITVDHYVKDPLVMAKDLSEYKKRSGGDIMLGEFGAPIPDIHGNLSEKAQAEYLDTMFRVMAQNTDVMGVNYWVVTDGSTEIVRRDGKRKEGASTLKKYFRPTIATGRVLDEIGDPLGGILITTPYRTRRTESDGSFRIPILAETEGATISGVRIVEREVVLRSESADIVATFKKEPFAFWVKKFIRQYFPKIYRYVASLTA